MDLITFAILKDWPILLPIIVCSIITVAVAFERWWFYRRNKRDIVQFIHRLERELHRSLDNAHVLSAKLGGIVGEVADEGIRILAERKARFEQSFDIATSLATRRLEEHLSILGTIATIAPYLGLFGTVVRILLTFGEMAKASGGNAAPQIMFGIGSALIATAFGLGVAITAVAVNNYFRTIVSRFEDDFQMLKMLFLSVPDVRHEAAPNPAYARQAMEQRGKF
jgi:biopolymer transport protein ExbB